MKNWKKPKFSSINMETQPQGNVLSKVLEEWPEEEFMKIDGYDDCVIGVFERYNMAPVLAYDHTLVVQETMDQSLMDMWEAVDYVSTQIQGAWVGDKTPAFLNRCITI